MTDSSGSKTQMARLWSLDLSRYIPAESRPALVLWCLIGLGLLFRLYNFTGGILDHHYLRQVDTDAIARNYVHEGMNLFLPMVDWRGSGNGIVEAEFPLFTYMVAILYKLFGEHTELARLLNLGFFTLTALTFFHLARRLYDQRIALLAVFFYSVTPLLTYFSRTLQPDAMMLLGLTAGLYFFIRWTDHDRWQDLAISALGIGVALTVKPLNVFMAAPLFYLCFNKFGWKLFIKPQLWAYGAVVLAPLLIWYVYSYSLWIEHGNTLYRAYSAISFEWLWNPEVFPAPLLAINGRSFFEQLLWRFFFLIATPGAIIFLGLGVWSVFRERQYLLMSWLGGFVAVMLVFAYQHRAHDYYQMPLALILSMLMAKGVFDYLKAPRSPRVLALILLAVYLPCGAWWYWKQDLEGQVADWWRVLFVVGGVLLAAFAAFPRPQRALVHIGLAITAVFGILQASLFTTEFYHNRNRTPFAERVAELTQPDDLVIFGTTWYREGWYQHRELEDQRFLSYDPVDLYLANRHGWSVEGAQLDPAYLDVLRQRGADYFAAFCCVGYLDNIIEKYPDLQEFMACAYTPVDVREEWTIYRLHEPNTRPDGSSCLEGLTPVERPAPLYWEGAEAH
jgi:4-amino-4-deoxy-L-arabinose transferase-like glycosyltransferase